MKSTEERIRDLEVMIGDLQTLIFFMAPCPECGSQTRRIEYRRIVCPGCGIASKEIDPVDITE